MKTNLLLLFLVLPIIAFSQPEYKTVESKILRQKRDIKIQASALKRTLKFFENKVNEKK